MVDFGATFVSCEVEVRGRPDGAWKHLGKAREGRGAMTAALDLAVLTVGEVRRRIEEEPEFADRPEIRAMFRSVTGLGRLPVIENLKQGFMRWSEKVMPPTPSKARSILETKDWPDLFYVRQANNSSFAREVALLKQDIAELTAMLAGVIANRPDVRRIEIARRVIARQMDSKAGGAGEVPAAEPARASPTPAEVAMAATQEMPTRTTARPEGSVVLDAVEGSDPTGADVEATGERVPPHKVRTGPWSVMPEIEKELRRRAAAIPNKCLKTWALESWHLWKWAGKKFKRDEETKTANPPSLGWIRQELSEVYYEVIPESERSRRRRNKS